MSGLLVPRGYPTTQAQGTEAQGKGVAPQGGDNAGTILTPNGHTVTPAADALVARTSANSGNKR
jgi:hypothetical protein